MQGVFLAKSFAFFIQFFQRLHNIFGNTSLTFFVEKTRFQRVPKVFLQLMCVLHIAHCIAHPGWLNFAPRGCIYRHQGK